MKPAFDSRPRSGTRRYHVIVRVKLKGEEPFEATVENDLLALAGEKITVYPPALRGEFLSDIARVISRDQIESFTFVTLVTRPGR